MSLRYLLVAVCLFHYSKDVQASGGCEQLPVFSPPRLVVKFGDPATATCSIFCNGSCNYDLRLEEPFKAQIKKGKDVIWNVTSFNQWDTFSICYVFNENCQQSLDVVVYNPPERVSVSFRGHSGGALRQGQTYSLQCDVKNVAPAQNMAVRFYRDHTELNVQSSNRTDKNPVNESFYLDHTVSREDQGATFWCEATLQLGPEGPQPPPMVRSHNFTAAVHYGPYRGGPTGLELSVTHGSSLLMNCSTEGNPSPHYNWTVPSASHTLFSHSVFTINSASSLHEGLYTCKATNELGAFSMTFRVTVHVNPLYIIIPTVVVAVLFAAVVYTVYRLRRMDQYNLKDVIHFSRHTAVPTSE